VSKSNIRYCRAKTDKELHQILGLQQKNLFANVTDEERKQEGFVTVAHDFDILKKMNEACPHIITKVNDKIIGYALCMHPLFSGTIAVLKPMFDEIETVNPKPSTYIAMGQICIDKDYRKQGIFRNLYQTMSDSLKPEFDAIITEVDAKNKRSLNAHYAIGFKHLKSYNSGGQNWELIILK
jgi:ribosomal protein S18 acetylase RimI-like enzyme